jgi:hypothetical protein
VFNSILLLFFLFATNIYTQGDDHEHSKKVHKRGNKENKNSKIDYYDEKTGASYNKEEYEKLERKHIRKTEHEKRLDSEKNDTDTHYYDEETGGMIPKTEADAAYKEHMAKRHEETQQKKLSEHAETIKQMKNSGRHNSADSLERSLKAEFGEKAVAEKLNEPAEEGFGWDEV